jgi:hypothetical protein
MFYVLYQTELRCCDRLYDKTYGSTGGIRTRDLGINSAVIPTAFAADGQNFFTFKITLQKLSKARLNR